MQHPKDIGDRRPSRSCRAPDARLRRSTCRSARTLATTWSSTTAVDSRESSARPGRLRNGVVFFDDVQHLRASPESEDRQPRLRRARSTSSPSSARNIGAVYLHPDRRHARNADRASLRVDAAKEQPGEGRTPSRGLRDRADRSLLKNLAALLVRQDLPLHPLQRVVDRLRVAAELFRHLLVRRAFEIQTQRVRLER